MIDFEKMTKEHEKLFPLATLDNQLLKLEEEMEEVKNAIDGEKRIKELADCIICCIGINRFAPYTANFIINSIVMSTFRWKEDLYNKVTEKWNINLKRKWEFKDGIYKHIGKDNWE